MEEVVNKFNLIFVKGISNPLNYSTFSIYFSRLANLLNSMIVEKVIPLYKTDEKKDKHNFTNYRLTSLFPRSSKIDITSHLLKFILSPLKKTQKFLISNIKTT